MDEPQSGVLEIAEIDINPGSESQFEQAVAQAAAHFRASHGCRSLTLLRSAEHPSRYRLVVGWDSIEAHTEIFRNSDGFQKWRALAGPHFAAPPRVEHVHTALKAF
jgi:quinol monooxygenase YgiN